MTTTRTSHTACTHPSTSAARAACRKGNAVQAVEAIAKAETINYSAFDYSFETVECDKCFGSGTPGYLPRYAGVYGGVCFSCNKGGNNKTGRKLTRAGKAAKAAHDAWIAEHLTILASELTVGMKFKPNAIDGWKTVVEAPTEPRISGYSITRDDEGNEVRTPMMGITVKSQKCSWGFGVDHTVQRAATPEERTALMAHLDGRKGFVLTPR